MHGRSWTSLGLRGSMVEMSSSGSRARRWANSGPAGLLRDLSASYRAPCRARNEQPIVLRGLPPGSMPDSDVNAGLMLGWANLVRLGAGPGVLVTFDAPM